jgi:hypothetical protein
MGGLDKEYYLKKLQGKTMEQRGGSIIGARLRGVVFFITRHACVQTNRPGLWGQTPPDCRTRMRYLVTKGKQIRPLLGAFGFRRSSKTCERELGLHLVPN